MVFERRVSHYSPIFLTSERSLYYSAGRKYKDSLVFLLFYKRSLYFRPVLAVTTTINATTSTDPPEHLLIIVTEV